MTTAQSSKRKRKTRAPQVTTSLSQMSLSNLPAKRQRSTTTTGNITEEDGIDKSIRENKPKYLKVPDGVFKEMLSKSMSDQEEFIQSSDTPVKIACVRTYAHLLNNVLYLQLERDFWTLSQFIYNRIKPIIITR